MLAQTKTNQKVTLDLLLQIISNERILERERGFAVAHYVRACRKLEMSKDEIALTLASYSNPAESILGQAVTSALNPDLKKIAQAETNRQKRVETKRRNDIIMQFAKFVVPFGWTHDFEARMGPVYKTIEQSEKLDGTVVLQAFCDMCTGSEGTGPILTFDRQDKNAASTAIDDSRHFLMLPDNETDLEIHSLPTHDQFEKYAQYLAQFDLHLAYLDVGWDDPCAVVLSKPEAFKAFLKEEFLDIECVVFR